MESSLSRNSTVTKYLSGLFNDWNTLIGMLVGAAVALIFSMHPEFAMWMGIISIVVGGLVGHAYTFWRPKKIAESSSMGASSSEDMREVARRYVELLQPKQ